jgi:inorganic pyrophosphatase
VLVVSPLPIIPGAVVRCRPIGMLNMQDEAGDDTKILAVPIDKLSPLYRDVQSMRDLPEIVLAQIAHFFEHYKDLERGKWVKITGWVGPEEAKKDLLSGVDGYRKAKKKPAF